MVAATLTMLCASGGVFGQQSCDESVPEWTPTDQFESLTADTVRDTRTGLIWMRCELGKTGKNCDGVPEYLSWDEAIEKSSQISAAGASAWRLPNIQELLSIAEDRCIFPALNTKVFPNAESGPVWTSWLSDDIANGAWFVHFGEGIPGVQFKGEKTAIRLVRDGS